MSRLEAGVQHAADVWTTGTKSILSAFQVQNVRFVHVERLLNLQRKSILKLQTELTDLYIKVSGGRHYLVRCLNAFPNTFSKSQK